MDAFARSLLQGMSEVGNAAFDAAGAVLDRVADWYVPVMFAVMACAFVVALVLS